MKTHFVTHISAFAILATIAQPALAGVRHSRSLGGTGQAIPKTESRQLNNDAQSQQASPMMQQGQQAYPQQVPNQDGAQQAFPMGTQQGAQQASPMGTLPGVQQVSPGGAQQVPPYQPMVVPPPVPVQVPTQMSFEPPLQVPQPAQGASPNPVQMEVPVQVPAQVPVLAPVQIPQQAPTQSSGQPQMAQPAQTNPGPGLGAPFSSPNNAPTVPLLPAQGQPSQPPLPAAATLNDRYVQPSYGMAGCGLGSMIFKNNVRSEQWLASILNDAIIPQSVVITTGTSNCVDVDEEQMQAEQEIFIDTNFHALRTESARGEGENLRAFADLLGCQKEGLFDTFAASSQGQHTYIFSDSQPSSIAERYREVLKRSRALKARCERLF
ncbi:DUF3015 domain-containing protein [bacterium]|nr:DUF3015 domain-containing protein [bacterium]